MVLGRAGLRLEAQKFALYLLIPITASLAFNEPTVQKWAADYFQFLKYPANPQTNLKDEYEALKKQRDEEIEWEKRMASKREKGRDEYLQQLKELQRGGGTDDNSADINIDIDTTTHKRGWFGWLKGWKRVGGKNDVNEG